MKKTANDFHLGTALHDNAGAGSDAGCRLGGRRRGKKYISEVKIGMGLTFSGGSLAIGAVAGLALGAAITLLLSVSTRKRRENKAA